MNLKKTAGTTIVLALSFGLLTSGAQAGEGQGGGGAGLFFAGDIGGGHVSLMGEASGGAGLEDGFFQSGDGGPGSGCGGGGGIIVLQLHGDAQGGIRHSLRGDGGPGAGCGGGGGLCLQGEGGSGGGCGGRL